MTDQPTTEAKTTAVIADNLMLAPGKVQPEHHLYNDLEADSLDICSVCIDLEDAFDIEVSDKDLDDVKTVQDLIRVVQTLKLGKGVPA